MKKYKNKVPIADLIQQLDSHMVELGYTKYTMRHFREAWSALKNLTYREGKNYFSKELAFKLLREHYHIEPYAHLKTSFKNVIRRSVMLLLEFQITGTIAKRCDTKENVIPKPYQDVYNMYINHIENNLNLSSGTIKHHKRNLEAFFRFLVGNNVFSFKSINANLINIYLKTFAGLTPKTTYSNIHILNNFFKLAYLKGYNKKLIELPKVNMYKDNNIKEYYSPNEIKKILKSIDRNNPKGKRDYAIILMAARYGLRVSDIKALKFSNFDFTNNKIHLIQCKTKKPLELDLLKDVGWAVIDYIKNGRPKSESKNIFIRHVVPYCEFDENDCLTHVLQQYATHAGIYKPNKSKGCHFHMLRYSLASDLIQHNVSTITVSNILGHSSLNSTVHYTQFNVPQLRKCSLEVPV